jgi:hypothetical protein
MYAIKIARSVLVVIALAAASARADLPQDGSLMEEPRAAMRQAQLPPSAKREIESALADVLASALKGNFDDVAENFTAKDRDRITAANYNDQAKNLRPAAEQLKNNWRTKYSQDLTPVTLPYTLSVGSDAKSATVRVPQSSGAQPIALAFVDEGTYVSKWRLDIPDSVSGPQLRDGLIGTLTRFNADKDTWPTDPAQTYQMVAQRIFAVVAGVKAAPAAAP